MRIILTHEQTDFDAIASLFGVSLLNEDAIPVLPHRMNRNVKAFLHLYRDEFPFIEQRDLPGEVIDEIILVDTQSLITLKGMTKNTKVRVIDHHPLKEGLPDSWDITIVNTGANTTILVEALRERNGNLTPIEATLLLLGIYEDTGSLTYSRTTPRDLMAAAFLLEKGANLRIANNFLNIPLSKVQQELYEKIIAEAKHKHIYGYTVMIGCIDAGDIDEELSSIVHKIRDNYEPDALFVVVKLRSGLQMVARSTTDNIDVGKIAEYFGGGGHGRAAASLIRDRELKDLCIEIEKLLPKYIVPQITVAQIMSRDPQLLSPTTSARDSLEKMKRFGYEGFPVVDDDGKVIGLLTRRGVDRALTHKLNLPAFRLMESGDYHVHPNDPISDVQRLMAETGWGQLPVLDSETNEIIGIVTRTDILKTLTPEIKLPEQHNVASKLKSALPPERFRLLKIIAEVAEEQHVAFYIVGGFVRDLLLGSPSLDFDLVVEGNAIELAYALSERYGGRVTSHARFGTAKWHIDQSLIKETSPLGQIESLPNLETIDLVTARTEFYTYPTALPLVERGSIKLDLHRRDFTINTLAIRLDGKHFGELYDYWGGLNDLRRGLVRVLHSLSFVDDPTRILRAVRFEQRFGFKIEKRTMELLIDAVPLLDKLSGDRIRHEFNHIFLEKNIVEIFKRLDELNILESIFLGVQWNSWLENKLELLTRIKLSKKWRIDLDEKTLKCYLGYIFLVIHLSGDNVRSVIKRLKFPSELRETIYEVRQLFNNDGEIIKSSPTSQIVNLLDKHSALAIYAFYLAVDDLEIQENIEQYIEKWQFVRPTITGDDLRKMGLEPGPIYANILSDLRGAWLDGKIRNRDDERKLLDSIIAWHSKGENNH